MDPIILIHGFGASTKQYISIVKYLKEKGIGNIYEFDYPNKFGFLSLKANAKDLAEFIEQNIKEKNINLIGISQGGIIALAYLKFYKNREVKKLFTLCTPHKGSVLAKKVKLPGIIELRPDSQLLKELEDFAKESKIEIYSVYTPFDLMVFPGWNAKTDCGKNKMVLAPLHPLAFVWPSVKKFIHDNLTK
jgi:triacylglycerol lipase